MDNRTATAETLLAHVTKTKMVEDTSAPVLVFHLLVDLLDYCDAHSVDLDVEISNAREEWGRKGAVEF